MRELLELIERRPGLTEELGVVGAIPEVMQTIRIRLEVQLALAIPQFRAAIELVPGDRFYFPEEPYVAGRISFEGREIVSLPIEVRP